MWTEDFLREIINERERGMRACDARRTEPRKTRDRRYRHLMRRSLRS